MGTAGFKIRMVDFDDQPLHEPAGEPFFQGVQFLGRPVAGDDDLLVRLFQGFKGMEEFFLGGFLFPQELDIVDEQHIDVPVFVPEGFVGVVLDGADQFVGEGFTGGVEDFHLGEFLVDIVADGVHQVGFPQAGIAVEKQGIVAFGRRVGHPHGEVEGFLIGFAPDEIVEGVFGRQMGIEFLGGFGGRLGFRLDCRRFRCRLGRCVREQGGPFLGGFPPHRSGPFMGFPQIWERLSSMMDRYFS